MLVFPTYIPYSEKNQSYLKSSARYYIQGIKGTLVIFIRLWHLPMIDYEMQVEGEHLGRGILGGRSTGGLTQRIIVLIRP
jgi:hypothetical protein